MTRTLPLMLFTVGCTLSSQTTYSEFREAVSPQQAELDASYGSDPVTEVRYARLKGHMPLVGDFDREATRADVFLWGPDLRLTLHGDAEDWVMYAGSIRLPLDLEDGQEVTLPVDEGDVRGCYGESEEEVVEDLMTDEVGVAVDTVVVDGELLRQYTLWLSFGADDEMEVQVVVPVAPDA